VSHSAPARERCLDLPRRAADERDVEHQVAVQDARALDVVDQLGWSAPEVLRGESAMARGEIILVGASIGLHEQRNAGNWVVGGALGE
jgi:hypothetical protein